MVYPYRYGVSAIPPYGQFYDRSASLRLQVSPRETEVFVDGYYAGTVDDFDGFFQRLHLEPGEHEVTLYLPGHRTVTQKILLQPGGTFRIRHTMEPLPAGAPPEPRPVAPAGPPPGTQGPHHSARRSARPAPRAGENTFGAIAIRVQPADAEVFIDGERWEGPSADEALVVQIAPGGHRIEVRKEGYRSYTTQVDVRAGETARRSTSACRGSERRSDEGQTQAVASGFSRKCSLLSCSWCRLPASRRTSPAQGPLVVERVHNPLRGRSRLQGDRSRWRVRPARRGLRRESRSRAALFIGGAGYWLVNGCGGDELAYGGLLAGMVDAAWAAASASARAGSWVSDAPRLDRTSTSCAA